MPEIGTSGLMSGEGKRNACAVTRLSSTLLLEKAGARRIGQIGIGLARTCERMSVASMWVVPEEHRQSGSVIGVYVDCAMSGSC
jgi:hypothetical protein